MGYITCSHRPSDKEPQGTCRKMKSSMIFMAAAMCFLLLVSVDAKINIEEEECEDQGKMCRKNGGSVDECTASVRACIEAVSGGPPPEVLGDEEEFEMFQQDEDE